MGHHHVRDKGHDLVYFLVVVEGDDGGVVAAAGRCGDEGWYVQGGAGSTDR
jgi:hypothetical protein